MSTTLVTNWSSVLLVILSKTKGQTFRYHFGNKTKSLWYRSRICLVENRLFRFGPESALWDQIEMISFIVADSGRNSDVTWFHSCWMSERLWNFCSFTGLTLLGTSLILRKVCPGFNIARVQRSSDGSASACCKAGPSSIPRLGTLGRFSPLS
jgi:hypothetical protein